MREDSNRPMNSWSFKLTICVAILTLAAATGAADKLRIGYGAPSVTMAPLWIAQEGKIFARNGLDIEVLYLESALVQRALIAGEISFGGCLRIVCLHD